MTPLTWLVIAAAFVGAGYQWLVKPMQARNKKLIDLEFKGEKCDAKEIVSKKTPADLVNDFNDRYPGDGKS